MVVFWRFRVASTALIDVFKLLVCHASLALDNQAGGAWHRATLDAFTIQS